jgi:uncharacterized coiled-coil protein SlyX
MEEQKTTIRQMQSAISEQEREIKALTATLQKVSNQLAAASPSRGALELTEPAPRVALNNPQKQ